MMTENDEHVKYTVLYECFNRTNQHSFNKLI